jgi:hypothetical protein
MSEKRDENLYDRIRREQHERNEKERLAREPDTLKQVMETSLERLRREGKI